MFTHSSKPDPQKQKFPKERKELQLIPASMYLRKTLRWSRGNSENIHYAGENLPKQQDRAKKIFRRQDF